jgi:hypothetical protein
LGARHTLFSRLLAFGAQFHPSSGLGCQLPDATLVSKDDCYSCSTPQRGRPVVSPLGRSGETSWPETRKPAGSLLPDLDWKPLRFGGSSPFAPGRHRASRRRSLAQGDGSCLLPLKLPFFSQADGLPASRSIEAYCQQRVLAGLHPTPSQLPLTPRGGRPHFSIRLRHRSDLAAREFVLHRRASLTPHWLAVATCGL